MTILRRRLKKVLAAVSVSPLLYMITFGYALGGRLEVDGRGYLEFLLPGLVAMSSMTQAFAIAGDINISRFYSRIFEEIQASPTSRAAYALGEICAGLTRMLLACAVILLLGALFGVRLEYGAYFWLGAMMNGFAFAALGVALAMFVTSHADQGMLNNFVITPMAFLGGTFFPVDKLPEWAQYALSVLPLTHASRAIRAAAFGTTPDLLAYLALGAACIVFFCLALYAIGKATD